MTAEPQGHAPVKSYRRTSSTHRHDPQDLHARLVVAIGLIMAGAFLLIVIAMSWSLVFVTQPIGQQAPNDAAFIEILKTMALFLTGSLGGVLASNGLKPKPKHEDTPKDTQRT